jgi:hypothetical protein
MKNKNSFDKNRHWFCANSAIYKNSSYNKLSCIHACQRVYKEGLNELVNINLTQILNRELRD